MPKINTDTLDERLNEALSRPAKRRVRTPIGEVMTQLIALFVRPPVAPDREERKRVEGAASYRVAAGG